MSCFLYARPLPEQNEPAWCLANLLRDIEEAITFGHKKIFLQNDVIGYSIIIGIAIFVSWGKLRILTLCYEL